VPKSAEYEAVTKQVQEADVKIAELEVKRMATHDVQQMKNFVFWITHWMKIRADLLAKRNTIK